MARSATAEKLEEAAPSLTLEWRVQNGRQREKKTTVPPGAVTVSGDQPALSPFPSLGIPALARGRLSARERIVTRLRGDRLRAPGAPRSRCE